MESSNSIENSAETDLGTASVSSPVGAVLLDLQNINEAEARKLMSEEHKALGYRPPPGSLAAEAQAAAAKHPKTVSSGMTTEQIREAALADAERIKNERKIDTSADTGKKPRKATVTKPQVAPASPKQPKPSSVPPHRVTATSGSDIGADSAEVDLEFIGEVEARKIMSEEHKALGYRPPPGSLAAEAQAAAAKHPYASSGLDAATLVKAAIEDAKRIESIRKASGDATKSDQATSEIPTTDAPAPVLAPGGESASGQHPVLDATPDQVQSDIEAINPATLVTSTPEGLGGRNEGSNQLREGDHQSPVTVSPAPDPAPVVVETDD